MSRILAVCYGAGHVNMVVPVAQSLECAGHEVVVLALTTAWGPATRAGLTTIGFRDFAGSDAYVKGRSLMGGIGAHPDVHPDETAAYLGLSYLDLEDQLGVEKAGEAFLTRGRQALLPTGVLRRIFAKVKPDLVLTTSSPRAERASVLVAQELGVPSVVLVDLMPQSELAWLSEVGYGTKVCVLSEGVRNRLLERGRFGDEIEVTGNPAFDELFELDRDSLRREWRSKWGFCDSDKVALFASQPDPDATLGSRAAEAVAVAGERAGWKVVVRPHPNEEFNIDLLPAKTRVSCREDSLWGALCGCDACVVISSSVGLQAAILGVSMVVLDTPVNADPAPYWEMGIGVTVQSADDVFAVLANRADCSTFSAAPATKKVVEIITGLLGEG